MTLALNATALRIAEFVERNPGSTKRQIATGLKLSDSTVEGYIGPLKAAGRIESQVCQPPRYIPGNGDAPTVGKINESTAMLVGVMHSMVANGIQSRRAA
ncbi:winged helix-turn-helix domain-containing protein [Paraburkholderia sp. J11-2]|uniref:winged helix-turn-helix domain-containing protein n=1 Tax=Paraburkholderia sp. J11-2 TaxID=2805431 RepID=UPI002AB6D06E|nr:winged helix-turn-helix domain-containing protein [Paraburkholderia sp. J11-2]